jgi:hypothetical protein
MKSAKWMLVLVSLVLGMVVVACGDNTTTQDGPMLGCVDQNADGVCDEITREEAGDDGVVINVVVQTCSSDYYCAVTEVCVKDSGLTRRFGHTVKVCDEGCRVDTESRLGSLCVVQDTCQRDGDEAIFCMSGRCRELTSAEKEQAKAQPRLYCDAQTASEGEGEGAGHQDTVPVDSTAAGLVTMTCCYGASVSPSWFGQFSYSNANQWTPQAWTGIRDRLIGADRCFSSEPVNKGSIVVGPWCDITTVLEPQAAPSDWRTNRDKPISAYLTYVSSGTRENLQIRYFEFGRGWRLGYIGGDDPDCSDAKAVCWAPGAPR